MKQDFAEFYNGDPEILDLITEAIQKNILIMIYYQPKNKMRKSQNYIIQPVRLRMLSTKRGLTLMLLAKQPSKQMRMVQFILAEIYAVKSYNPNSSENKVAGVTVTPVNAVKARSSFKRWGHFNTGKD